jgi:hypothetical protein
MPVLHDSFVTTNSSELLEFWISTAIYTPFAPEKKATIPLPLINTYSLKSLVIASVAFSYL